MRIGLQSWGTDGDLFPFLALAIGLKNAGHEVSLAFTSVDGKSHAQRAEIEGIRYMEANGGRHANADVDPYSIAARPGSFLEYSSLLKLFFDPYAEAMFEASETLCKENDLVIGHPVCHTLLTAAQKHNCPRVSLVLTPLVVRSKYVSPIGIHLGVMLNSMMWWVGDRLSTRLWFKAAKEIRAREGLPPIRSLQGELFTSDVLTLVAASPSLVPQWSDQAENVEVIGFLNLPATDSGWNMPKDLKTFLDAGKAPVFMTFGSCMQFNLEASTKLMVDAALASGKRTIIQSDWNKLTRPQHPDIFCIGLVPHSEVFPLCSLMVHHGGAGTTQAALLAGRPSVVVAHGFDQPYWGRLLEKAGAGGQRLMRNGLSADQLAAQIMAVASSASISTNANIIGTAMKQEHGVLRAVEAIAGIGRRYFR